MRYRTQGKRKMVGTVMVVVVRKDEGEVGLGRGKNKTTCSK
jgi:ribosomal protein S5